jgi:hypothetical protein
MNHSFKHRASIIFFEYAMRWKSEHISIRSTIHNSSSGCWKRWRFVLKTGRQFVDYKMNKRMNSNLQNFPELRVYTVDKVIAWIDNNQCCQNRGTTKCSPPERADWMVSRKKPRVRRKIRSEETVCIATIKWCRSSRSCFSSNPLLSRSHSIIVSSLRKLHSLMENIKFFPFWQNNDDFYSKWREWNFFSV